MPRFFFHVRDEDTTRDEEGQELPDLDAAKREAIEGLRDLLCGEVRYGRIDLGRRIEVADEAGATVLTVTAEEAVRLER